MCERWGFWRAWAANAIVRGKELVLYKLPIQTALIASVISKATEDQNITDDKRHYHIPFAENFQVWLFLGCSYAYTINQDTCIFSYCVPSCKTTISPFPSFSEDAVRPNMSMLWHLTHSAGKCALLHWDLPLIPPQIMAFCVETLVLENVHIFLCRHTSSFILVLSLLWQQNGQNGRLW